MSLFTRVARGFRAMFRKTRAEAELDAELQDFLAAAVAEKQRAGMSERDARRAAGLELGSIDAVKDRVRDVGWESVVESFWRDLRYAIRLSFRSPGFTIAAVASLAIGIGVNTAIFQLADAVRLRPLPVEHPEQLAEIRMADPTRGRMGTFAGRRPLFTNALWEELRRRQHAFSGVVAWGAYPVNLATRGEARYVQGLWVTGDFFNVLGVTPHLGRLLTSQDDQPGCGSPAAVLSYSFWQRQYGGEASVIGKAIVLDGHSFEVVGIARRGFVALEVGRTFDVATPLCAEPILNHEHSALTDRSWWWLTVIGRLAPGWSLDRASNHLASISAGIFQDTMPVGLPPELTQAYLGSVLKAFPAATGVSGTVREEYETPLWVLLGAAGIVLIIASANIATLLLARASARERELVVRLAIGASRGRLITQLLTESVLMAVAGAIAGMLLAQSLSEGLIGLLQTSGFQFFAVTFDLDRNWRVLLFGTAVACVTCLLFGLAPAIMATRPSAGSLLRGTRRTATESRPRIGARSALVVAQVALSLVLVVTALLFARTLHNLTTGPVGFKPDGIAMVVVDYQRANVPAGARPALHDRLLDAIRAVPGVQSAASVRMIPLTGESWTGHVVVDGVQQQKQAYFNRVSPTFFQTMGTSLVAGRDFTTEDSAGARLVAIVNESFAHEFLGTPNPIGSRFQMPPLPGTRQPTFEIIGLVNDTKYTALRDPFEPIAFFPASQDPRPLEYANLVVRTTMPVMPRSLTEAVNRVEPAAVVLVQSLSAQVSDSLVRERLMAMLSGFFGAVAALLAMLGLYGVVAYGVTRRTREIGIRAALGAQRSDVLRLVLQQSALLTAAGVVLGLGGAAGATRYLEGMLFGLTPLDPETFAAVAIAFPVVAAFAAYLPARRATKVDPMIALRCE